MASWGPPCNSKESCWIAPHLASSVSPFSTSRGVERRASRWAWSALLKACQSSDCSIWRTRARASGEKRGCSAEGSGSGSVRPRRIIPSVSGPASSPGASALPGGGAGRWRGSGRRSGDGERLAPAGPVPCQVQRCQGASRPRGHAACRPSLGDEGTGVGPCQSSRAPCRPGPGGVAERRPRRGSGRRRGWSGPGRSSGRQPERVGEPGSSAPGAVCRISCDHPFERGVEADASADQADQREEPEDDGQDDDDPNHLLDGGVKRQKGLYQVEDQSYYYQYYYELDQGHGSPPLAGGGWSPSFVASAWMVSAAGPSSVWSFPSDGSLLAWHLALEVAFVGGLRQATWGLRHGVARGVHPGGGTTWGTRWGATVRTPRAAWRRSATHHLLLRRLRCLLLRLHLLHRVADGVALDVLRDLLLHVRRQVLAEELVVHLGVRHVVVQGRDGHLDATADPVEFVLDVGIHGAGRLNVGDDLLGFAVAEPCRPDLPQQVFPVDAGVILGKKVWWDASQDLDEVEHLLNADILVEGEDRALPLEGELADQVVAVDGGLNQGCALHSLHPKEQ